MCENRRDELIIGITYLLLERFVMHNKGKGDSIQIKIHYSQLNYLNLHLIKYSPATSSRGIQKACLLLNPLTSKMKNGSIKVKKPNLL